MSNDGIIGISVDWQVDWNQRPELRVHVDYDASEFTHKARDCAWHPYPDNPEYIAQRRRQRRHYRPGTLWARSIGRSRWEYLYEQPGNHNGFGGRTFRLRMLDGSYREVRGPWSSSARAASSRTGVDLLTCSVFSPNGSVSLGTFEVEAIQEAIDRVGAAVLLDKVPLIQSQPNDPKRHWMVVTSKPEPAPPIGWRTTGCLDESGDTRCWNRKMWSGGKYPAPVIDYWPHDLAPVGAVVSVSALPNLEVVKR